MELYLIRHAQSANNHLYDIGGEANRVPDPPLTGTGHRQAQLLADYLAARPAAPPANPLAQQHNRDGFPLTHLYTSLMLRAIQTAGYVAQATGLTPHAWTEIHECGGLHGIEAETGAEIGVSGPNRAFFATEYPHLVLPDTLGEAGWWSRDREPREQYVPRAVAVWRDLLARHGNSDDRVALITHGGFFRALFATFLGVNVYLPNDQIGLGHWRVAMNNTSISRFGIHDDWSTIRYLNRVDHLPDELLTA